MSSKTYPQFANLRYAAPRAPKKKTGSERAWSVADLLNEADRVPSASAHVQTPLLPAWKIGSAEGVKSRATQWHLQARQSDGKRARADSPCLACAVISLPAARKDDWPAYRDDAIRFFRDRLEERVVGAVEHLDEPHPHLHIYLVPRDGEGFGIVHPGYGASRRRRKTDNKVGTAYRQAMSAWQDAVHEGLGKKYGLERFGPRRRRMQREEWSRSTAARTKRGAMLAEAEEKLRLARKHERDVEEKRDQLAKRAEVLRQFQKQLLQTPAGERESEMKRLRERVDELGMENASLRRERDAQKFREGVREQVATDQLKRSPRP